MSEYTDIIDLDGFTHLQEREKWLLAKEVCTRIYKHGFIQVTSHKLNTMLFHNNYHQFHEFCKLSDEVKIKYARPDIASIQGFLPMRKRQGYVDNQFTLISEQESWHTGRNNNYYPYEFSGFQVIQKQIFSLLENLGVIILDLIGRYFKDNGYIKTLIVDKNGCLSGNHLLRTIRYPAIYESTISQVESTKMILRHLEHEDLSLITILPSATAKGLQIQNEYGEWQTIRSQDVLTVIPGNMLRYILQGRDRMIRPVLHRVISSLEGVQQERYSSAMFLTPYPTLPIINLTTEQLVKVDNIAIDKAGLLLYQFLLNRGRGLNMGYEEFLKKQIELLQDK